jgi:hypothetical protein
MQELREGLLQIKNSSISSSFITPRHYSSLISTLSVDMGGIEKSIQYINGKEIDVSVLNNNLDTVLKAVSELSAKVRFQGE